uniref:Uncharacterized protein n=1 Tax=Bicosoecida sp. CB-2014 TaxID=1486930 RepID=A0A7S1GC15_9STRA
MAAAATRKRRGSLTGSGLVFGAATPPSRPGSSGSHGLDGGSGVVLDYDGDDLTSPFGGGGAFSPAGKRAQHGTPDSGSGASSGGASGSGSGSGSADSGSGSASEGGLRRRRSIDITGVKLGSTASKSDKATAKRVEGMKHMQDDLAARRKAERKKERKAKRRLAKQEAAVQEGAADFGRLQMSFTNDDGDREVLPLLSLVFRYIITEIVIGRKKHRKLTVRNIVGAMNQYLQRKFLGELMRFGVLTSQKLRKHLALNDWLQDTRQLHLPNFDLGARDLSLLVFVLDKARYRSVDLRGNPISGPQITYIAPIINKAWLTHLTLSDTKITSIGCQVLARALPDTNLQVLDLRNAKLGVADFTHGSVEYDGTGIIELLSCLTKKESLTALDVSHNALFGVRWEESAGSFMGDIYHLAVKAFAKLLYRNRGLANVFSSYNALGGYYNAAAEHIEAGKPTRFALRGLTANATNVAVLDLAHCGLRTTGADALGEMLDFNRTITKLDLRGNTLGFQGFRALARALYSQPVLTALNLSANKGRDEGVVTLCAALEMNESVRELDLSFNDIREEGCVSLTTMVEKNKTLRKLWLQCNRFGPLGAFPLIEAIGFNRKLRVVDLSSVYMYADQRFDPNLVKKNRYVNAALVRLCEETHSMQHLDLRRNYIPAEVGVKMKRRLRDRLPDIDLVM